MEYGFVKVAAGIPHLKVADCDYNEKQIENIIVQAEGKGVEVICFPELCITGYTCGDLFTQQLLLDCCENALYKLLDFTRSLNIISIIGMPVRYNSALFNSAVVIQGGKILGIVPKTHIQNNEQKWFAAGNNVKNSNIYLCAQNVNIGTNLLFNSSQYTFGIEIGHDIWAPIQPSTLLALKGAEIIFNPSAYKEIIGNHKYCMDLVTHQSARLNAGYISASCGHGESTQDSVYMGKGIICENGKILVEGERLITKEQILISEIDVELLTKERRSNTYFASCSVDMTNDYSIIQCQPTNTTETPVLTRYINPTPFVSDKNEVDQRCEEVFATQVAGLAQRVIHTNAQTLIIGISGGLDSTLALLVCVKTMDILNRERKDILGITMPGFGTTNRTYTNAISLMKSLGITIKEISIRDACTQHFKDISHDMANHDVTYENSQARERTQILMDLANKYNGLVVGTGDLSELALGWATYNGDHMSNYGVNSDVPKTLIRHIVRWIAKNYSDKATSTTLLDIVDTPISPELIPADEKGNIKQKTEDLVGPYELHDFFLYHFVRNGYSPNKIFYLAKHAFCKESTYSLSYNDDEIKKWLSIFCRRFFNQQFKRSCMPDGPQIGTVSLSPRGAWEMPSDANCTLWTKECDTINT